MIKYYKISHYSETLEYKGQLISHSWVKLENGQLTEIGRYSPEFGYTSAERGRVWGTNYLSSKPYWEVKEVTKKDIPPKIAIYQVGQRIQDKGLGWGTVVSFEHFTNNGKESFYDATDNGEKFYPSRIVLKLDKPENWAPYANKLNSATNGNPCIYRGDIVDFE